MTKKKMLTLVLTVIILAAVLKLNDNEINSTFIFILANVNLEIMSLDVCTE